MPTLTWPAGLLPSAMEWGLQANTQSFESPLTGSVQTLELPSPRWLANLTFEHLKDSEAAALQAFLASLRGRAGRFSLHNFARPVPRGTAAGTPLVAGAGQTGTSLNLDGFTAGTTLEAGDLIGVNGELKMVKALATAAGAGAMTVSFEPPLRASPADNAPITLNQPTATFMLAEDVSRWSVAPGLITSLTLSCIEVFS